MRLATTVARWRRVHANRASGNRILTGESDFFAAARRAAEKSRFYWPACAAEVIEAVGLREALVPLGYRPEAEGWEGG